MTKRDEFYLAEIEERIELLPEMRAMRNRLIHGYFSIDYDIVWNVASAEIAKLLPQVRKAMLEVAPSIHPWRNCTTGYYYVRPHGRIVQVAPFHPDGVASVREHCRRNPSGKDQLYPKEMKWMLESYLSQVDPTGKVGSLPEYAKAGENQFDREIVFWTQYWNEIFQPKDPLDPNVVKALLASESSFNPKITDQKLKGKKSNCARGLMQLTDETRGILQDEKGEIRNHYLTLSKDDVRDPGVAIGAAVRWLFYKRQYAGGQLKREASWEEAIAYYKAYLKAKRPDFQHRAMLNFQRLLRILRGEGT